MNINYYQEIQGGRSPVKNMTKSSDKKFSQQEEIESQNMFIYGLQVNCVNKKGSITKQSIYFNDFEPQFLQFCIIGQKECSKLKFNEIVYIDDKPSNKSQILKNQFFVCIVMKSKEKPEIVVAFENKEQKELWQHGLQNLIDQAFTEEQKQNKNDLFRGLASQLFNDVGHSESAELNHEQIEGILKQLHIKFDKKYMDKIYDRFDADNSGTINFKEFRQILLELMKKDELSDLYAQYSNVGLEEVQLTQSQTQDSLNSPTAKFITLKSMQSFLQQEQGDDIQENIIEQNWAQKCWTKKKTEQGEICIDFYTFNNYIFSMENSIFDPEKAQIYQNMDRPMCDYYISTSHNTYITQGQLMGASSINCYKKVLLEGCRCVELDTWDGPKEPIITHGHTLTSNIGLREVLETIKKYAFQVSPFPVILSFQNQCNKNQTALIGRILKQIFGNMLYCLPLNYDKFQHFKSPETLRYKIIVKSKSNIFSLTEFAAQDPLVNQFTSDTIFKKEMAIKKQFSIIQSTQQSTDNNSTSEATQQAETIVEAEKDEYFQRKNMARQYSIQSYQTLFDDPIKQGNIGYREVPFSQCIENQVQFGSFGDLDEAKAHNKILMIRDESDQESLSDCEEEHCDEDKVIDSKELVNVTSMFGCKLKSISKWPQRNCFHISSVNETITDHCIKDPVKMKEMVDFHKKYFSRIYPKGSRIDSSNYDYIKGFLIGSQLVALNFQTLDMNMVLYNAKFQQNGGFNSGYILKPKWQRSDCQLIEQKYLDNFNKPQLKIKMKIISGQQIKYDCKQQDAREFISPFVKVQIRGIPIDNQNNKIIKTNTAKKNSLNPQFMQDCEFNIHCVDLAMIYFQILDSNHGDKCISQYALPVECIRKGYRVVPLVNNQLNLIDHSFLLVNIQLIQLQN